MIYFELFTLGSIRTIAVHYALYLKEQLNVLHQLLSSMARLSYLINNKDEKLGSHKLPLFHRMKNFNNSPIYLFNTNPNLIKWNITEF